MERDLTLDHICAHALDIVSREIEGRIVILPLLNGIADADQQIYTLSETGMAIWCQLDGNKTLGQIAAELAESFTSHRQEIEKDVLGIATEMIRRGICLKINGKGATQKKIEGVFLNNDGCISSVEQAQINSSNEEPATYFTRGGELILSNPGQLALLKGMEDRGVPLRTTVRGFSMHPFIRDRDVLTIAPLKGHSPDIGDVVAYTYQTGGRMAIHRIINRAFSGWLIKGDNLPEAGAVVTAEQIIGRVVRIERSGKEVRLSLGREKKVIAILNRGSGLVHLKKLWYLPRRIAGFALRSLQNLSLYRLLGRRFAPPFNITIATDGDQEEVQSRLNPFVPYRKQPANPYVTNLVAKTSSKLAGFVQLVYHPEEHYPWTGYWLFSLHVWGRYRALGVGEQLTLRVIDEAKKLGVSFLYLAVYEDNFKAINLYRKLGFFHVTFLLLEALLAAEKEKSGRRRIVMVKKIEVNQ